MVNLNNLIGFAVVSKNHLAISNMNVQKLFLDKPLEVFQTVEKAI